MKKQRTFYKVIAILLVLFAFLLSGCQKNTALEKEEKLQIVATIFPPYDFAREIGKDRVEVTMLLRPRNRKSFFRAVSCRHSCHRKLRYFSLQWWRIGRMGRAVVK